MKIELVDWLDGANERTRQREVSVAGRWALNIE